MNDQELIILKEQLNRINKSVKYLAHTRQSLPLGNEIERIIYKADWECVSTLTDRIEEFLEKY